jgi:hypothetical protein
LTRGRPPVPAEVKRARGTARPDRMPDESNVLQLPGAIDTPQAPVGLGLEGMSLWKQIWEGALLWLSPRTDMAAIEEACRLEDDVAIARMRYRATSDPRDARALFALNKALTSALSSLGFDPAARTRLGVAEVKAASAIEKLLERKERRKVERE